MPAGRKSAPPRDTQLTRVLVIEDDQAIRSLIAYALGDEGYEVDEAPEGRQALGLIAQRHPDIIVLDMKMPGMDGWEFARLYRERYEAPAPIVVVTAAKDAAQRGTEVDAESWLAKPFDLAELVNRVSAVAQKADLQ